MIIEVSLTTDIHIDVSKERYSEDEDELFISLSLSTLEVPR